MWQANADEALKEWRSTTTRTLEDDLTIILPKAFSSRHVCAIMKGRKIRYFKTDNERKQDSTKQVHTHIFTPHYLVHASAFFVSCFSGNYHSPSILLRTKSQSQQAGR